MKKRILKTSLFGFSKAQVCEYITRVNLECNDTVNKLYQKHEAEKADLLSQIAKLNAALEEQKRAAGDAEQAIQNAQAYAAELRAKADAEYRAALEEIRKMKEQEAGQSALDGKENGNDRESKPTPSREAAAEAALPADFASEYQSEEGMTA